MPIPAVALESVSRRFGESVAVDAIDLTIAPGEFVALIGPSGCGKTTTLRLVAGLERPTAGRILIDGADVTHAKPWDRDTPMVWQNFALFPHLDVGENVAYGLRRRGVGKAEVERRVTAALDMVGITTLARRDITQLSGGQKQRTGIARALVLDPKVLLLDEPLSALDANLRIRLQGDLRAIHRRLGVTFVYVTHYQNEAFAMADRVVVMNGGRIVQSGTPEDVYRRPASRFVAEFIGLGNIFSGQTLAGDESAQDVLTEAGVFVVPGRRPENTDLSFAIPADRMILAKPGMPIPNGIDGNVIGIEFFGATLAVTVAVGHDLELKVQKAERDVQLGSVAVGDHVRVGWEPEDAYVFPDSR